MRKQKHTFIATVAITTLTLLLGATYLKQNSLAAEKEAANIKLSVQMLVGGEAGEVAFTIENIGNLDFETTPVGTNYSRLIIQRGAKTEEDYYWANIMKPTVVRAGEKIVWKKNILTRWAPINVRAGEYSLKWSIVDPKNTDNRICTSNELRFYVEQDLPREGPIAGRPELVP